MPWFATLRLLSLFAALMSCYLLTRALMFESKALRINGEVTRAVMRQGETGYRVRFIIPSAPGAAPMPGTAARSGTTAPAASAPHREVAAEIETPPSRWVTYAIGQKVPVLYDPVSGSSEVEHPYLRFGAAGLSGGLALALVILSHRARRRYEAAIARQKLTAPRNL